ncbi:MAG: DUF4330 family protein [Acidobacteria bacterium]|nr:DUF4330 family protein [Acidobacteriota bacterium]
MSLIDARGRLFGRFNLIDAGVAIFILALVPAGLVTYRVFRVPNPEIASVSPDTVPPGGNRRLRLTGRHFRPYLRVTFNRTGEAFALVDGTPESTEGRLLTETPTLVEVQLPELAPGAYDLHLFDEGQQVAEKLHAFTVSGGPPMRIDAVVRFVVSPDLAAMVAPGDEDAYVPPGPPPPSDQPQATLGAVTVLDGPAASQLRMSPQLGGYMAVEEPGLVLEAVVAIPAGRGAAGLWEYKKQPIRAGDALRFETPRYAMLGIIRKVAEP